MAEAARTLALTDHPGHRYAVDVWEDRIPAGRWAKLACRRYLDDIDRDDMVLLPDMAQHAIGFLESLRQSKGKKWAGKQLDLQPWQQFIVWNLFGWYSPDESGEMLRRFRSAYLELPRKNGKSTMAAAIGLYLLVGDEEPGAEIYSAATTRDQAKLVWTEANRMAEKSPSLREKVQLYKASIFVPGSSSSFVPLASREDKLDGLNVHGALVDELHAHPGREVWDKLETGMGSRDQPMIIGTTTAGHDTATFCYEMRRYAENVVQGVLDDPTFFAYVACPDEGDDWQAESTWKKANPNWGVSVLPADMRRLATKAAAMPAARNSFRRLRLNLWTSATGAWLDMDRWAACDGAVNAEELEGMACWGGLDLASTMDLTALVLVFPTDDERVLRVVPRFWMPRENIAKRSREDRIPYDEWARAGLLVATPGEVTDYDVVLADVAAAAALHDLRELAFDPYNATQIAAKMIGEELPMVEHRQGFLSMNAPMKELERLIHSRRIAHGGHPILRWMAANTVASRDASENIKPDKAKSREKIDGIVALIMAVSRWMLTGAADRGSIYDTEGIEVL